MRVCVCVCARSSSEAVGSAPHRRTMSHEEVLGGRLAATTSFTLNRTGRQNEEKPSGEDSILPHHPPVCSQSSGLMVCGGGGGVCRGGAVQEAEGLPDDGGAAAGAQLPPSQH